MAQTSQRIAELLFKYSQDKSGLAKVLADNKTVRDELDKTAKTSRSLADVYDDVTKGQARAVREEGIDRLAEKWRDVYNRTRNADDATLAVTRDLHAMGASSAEIDRVTSAIARMNAEQAKSAASRTLGQSVTKFGRGLMNAPDIGPSTDIARGLIAGGNAIDKFNVSGAQLTGVLTIAAPLALIAAAAYDRLNRTVEAGRRRLEAALIAQDAYYEAIGNLTSALARAQIAQLEAANADLKRQIDENRNAADTQFEALAAQGSAAADLYARLVDGTAGIETLAEKADDLQTKFDANVDTINRLTQGLADNEFKTNDALDLARRQIELQSTTSAERQKAIEANNLEIASLQALAAANLTNAELQQVVGERVDELNTKNTALAATSNTAADALAEIEARLKGFQGAVGQQLQAQQMTAAERAKQIEQNNLEIAVLQQLAAANANVAGVAEYTKTRLDELALSNLILGQTTESYADKQKALADAIAQATARTDDQFRVNTSIAEAYERIAATREARDKARLDLEKKLADIAAERQAKEDALADKLLIAQQEADADRIKLAADTEKRLTEIRKEASDDLGAAIRRGDRVRARQIRQDREDELAKEKDRAKEQGAIIDERLQKAVDAANRELQLANDTAAQKTEAARIAGEAEIEERKRAYQQAQVDLQNAVRAANDLRQMAQANEQAQAVQHQSNLLATVKQGAVNIGLTWSLLMSSLATAVQIAQQQILTGGGGWYAPSPPGGTGTGSGGGKVIGSGFGRATTTSRPLPVAGSGGGVTVDMRGMTISAGSGADARAIAREFEAIVGPKIVRAVRRGVQE